MKFESGTGIKDVVVTDPVYKMFGMVRLFCVYKPMHLSGYQQGTMFSRLSEQSKGFAWLKIFCREIQFSLDLWRAAYRKFVIARKTPCN